MNMDGKTVIVAGLGVSGQSMMEVLGSRAGRVLGVDEKKPDADLHSFDQIDWDNTDMVMTSPVFNPRTPFILEAQKRNIPVMSEVELAWQLRVNSNTTGKPAQWIGTNGKTSTTEMTSEMLTACGLTAPAVGNIGKAVSHAAVDPANDVLCVELSSFQLHFTYSLELDCAAITNIADDHLDWHGGIENYAADKAKVFHNVKKALVYNADDPWAERLMADATCPRRFSYSVNGQADLMAKNVALEPGSVDFDAEADTEWCHVHVGIPALFTVYNTLDAMACCWNLGVPLAECADALAKNHGVKGRMEIIPTPGTGYTVLNDYAHKPDALEKVLQSAKAFAKGRVVALFGCGGDRDKTKRPVMGEIGARLADFVIVTSDNPRTEKPEAIIDDILVGLKGYDTPYAVIPDRVAAIHYAMDHAQPGDVIVLAGKGHEDYQEIDHKHYPMDERVIVAEHLKETQK